MGKESKEEDRSRERTFRAISSLFSVVLRLDLSDIRWMDDSSVHTLRKKGTHRDVERLCMCTFFR